MAFVLAVLTLADPPAQPQPDAPAQAQPAPSQDATVTGLTVTGTRADVETSIDRRSYAVANDLNAQTGSIADVLRDIPSIQIDPQGNPTLQGQGNVTILVDGRPSSQFSGQNLGQALQAMPADRIDRIEVMTNPPAEFRAQGGAVINLITKKAKGAGSTGSLRLSGETHHRASSTLNLGYNSDKLSATADVTYQRQNQGILDVLDQSCTDLTKCTAFTAEDRAVQHWTGNNWQGHVGADYDLDSRTRLSAVVRYATDSFDTFYADNFIDQPSGAPSSLTVRTDREFEKFNKGDASLTWLRTYAEGHTLSFNVDYKGFEIHDDRTDFITPDPASGFSPNSQQVIWTELDPRATFTADYLRPLAGGKLKLGYDFEYAPNRFDQITGAGPFAGPIAFDPLQHDVFLDTETDNEAYVSYERTVGKLNILTGLRGEDARFDLEEQGGVPVSHTYARLYPNLHLAYDLSDGRQLTASFSRRTDRPGSRQLDPFVTSQTPVREIAGNTDFRPDDNYRYELGYESRHGDRTQLVTLYYRDLRDAFNTIQVNQPGGVLLIEPVNAGQVRTAGAEWSYSDKLTPKITVNVSADAYWAQLSAPKLGTPVNSTVTGFGHGSLTWQLTPKDVLQVSAFLNGKFLQPQGYNLPSYSGSLGYRHTINPKMSWMIVATDPFKTLRYRDVEAINGVTNRHVSLPANSSISLAFVWNFAGKPKEAAFDIGSGEGGR